MWRLKLADAVAEPGCQVWAWLRGAEGRKREWPQDASIRCEILSPRYSEESFRASFAHSVRRPGAIDRRRKGKVQSRQIKLSQDICRFRRGFPRGSGAARMASWKGLSGHAVARGPVLRLPDRSGRADWAIASSGAQGPAHHRPIRGDKKSSAALRCCFDFLFNLSESACEPWQG